MVLFADDTNLLIIEKNESALQYKIKYVTKELGTWFHTNNFKINTNKNCSVYCDVHTVHFVLFIIHTNKCTNIYIKIFYKYFQVFQCFCTILRET